MFDVLFYNNYIYYKKCVKFLFAKKKKIVINNKRKFYNYDTIDDRKNKMHKKNFNNLNNKLYP